MHRMIHRHRGDSTAGGKSGDVEVGDAAALKKYGHGRLDGRGYWKLLIVPLLAVFVVGVVAVYNLAYVKARTAALAKDMHVSHLWSHAHTTGNVTLDEQNKASGLVQWFVRQGHSSLQLPDKPGGALLAEHAGSPNSAGGPAPAEKPHELPTDFNWKIYLSNYDDLRAAGITTQQAAEEHYMRTGYAEHRVYSSLVVDHMATDLEEAGAKPAAEATQNTSAATTATAATPAAVPADAAATTTTTANPAAATPVADPTAAGTTGTSHSVDAIASAATVAATNPHPHDPVAATTTPATATPITNATPATTTATTTTPVATDPVTTTPLATDPVTATPLATANPVATGPVTTTTTTPVATADPATTTDPTAAATTPATTNPVATATPVATTTDPVAAATTPVAIANPITTDPVPTTTTTPAANATTTTAAAGDLTAHGTTTTAASDTPPAPGLPVGHQENQPQPVHNPVVTSTGTPIGTPATHRKLLH